MFVSGGEAWTVASGFGGLAPWQDQLPKGRQAGETISWTLPGFLGKVRFQSSFGLLPIEAMRVNDPICTTTGRNLPVRRIKRIGLDRDFLLRHPGAQPVQIAANAFGRGVPATDILVSPGQELTVQAADQRQHKMRAGDISGNSAVVRALHGTIVYYGFELSEPAYVYAEGVPVLIPAAPGAGRDKDDGDE